MKRTELQRAIRILQMRRVRMLILSLFALGLGLYLWLPIVRSVRYDIKIRKPIFKINDCVSETIRHGNDIAIHPYKILRIDQHNYLMELLFNNPEHKSEFEKFAVVDEHFKKMNCPSITSPTEGTEVKIPPEFQTAPDHATELSTPSESPE